MQYRRLGRSGLRVSEAALGTMTFGEEWGWGSSRETARAVFDAYVEAGGNFVDTADRYTNGTAERLVGEFVADGHDREEFVVATKYTLSRRDGDPNASGNHRKNMFAAVDASLDRLGTDYVDLLWVHAWDGITPVEEVLRGLDDLVSAGKVHYVGLSDFPAWVAARAVTLAEERDYAPVAAIQVKYNLLERTVERELLPMAGSLGLGVTAWGPLESGILTGKYLGGGDGHGEGRATVQDREMTDRERRVAELVVEIADEAEATPAQVAVSWLRHRRAAPIPILGATRPEQLDELLDAMDLSLAADHLERLDEATRVPMGFPLDFLADEVIVRNVYGGTYDALAAEKPY